MAETPPASFYVDQPRDGSSVAAETVLIRGWAIAAGGQPYADLRVITRDGILPVAAGFLRPDLIDYFKLSAAQLPAGFEAHVPVVPGPQEYRIEGCDISGHWRPIGTLTLTGTAAAPAAPDTTLYQLEPHQFGQALEWMLRQPAPAPAGVIAATRPMPAATRFPPHPFHGHLEQPHALDRIVFGRMQINGWLFHETARIRRIAATVDLQAWQEMTHGLDSPHIGPRFPQFPQAQTCRFNGLIDVPAQLPQPLSVRVYAQLEDGSWHLCHVYRATVSDQEQAKQPFAAIGTTGFVQAARRLRAAFRARNLQVSLGAATLGELRTLHRRFRAEAARPAAPAATLLSPPAGSPSPLRRVALVTHNLNYEGAPLFLLEHARHLAGQGVALEVVSAAPGPLEAEYARLGAPVRLLDARALLAATGPSAWRAALRRLAGNLDWSGVDLVVANTLSVHWGVHLAAQAGRPSLFYIHESTTPANFYHGHAAPALLPLVHEAFARATHVSFLTAATRRYYEPLLVRSNHGINPGWIDLARIDRYRADHPRAELRRRLGLADATPLVVNLGTVCDRKGQHIFARAVDLAWRRQPALAAAARFAMVGARQTSFDRAVAGLLAELGRPNLELVPETPDPLAWLVAADLFVCSSYEESFPRVVLEAMACAVPVLSTDVHGIPEMIRPGTDGLLVPAGNSAALAEGLRALLGDPAQGRQLAERARARVGENFDARLLLPRHFALACGLAAGGR